MIAVDSPVKTATRVLLVSPQPELRQRIEASVVAAHDMMLLSDYDPAEDGRMPPQPDVIVVDATNSMQESIATLKQLKLLHATAKYLCIGTSCDDGVLIEAIRAGMDGFLWYDDVSQENLLRCIRGACAGELVLPRRMAGKLLPLLRELPMAETPVTPQLEEDQTSYGLTPREMEVLRLVARGARNKEIAAQLFITPSTVNKHVQNILNKLNVHSRVAALREVRQRARNDSWR